MDEDGNVYDHENWTCTCSKGYAMHMKAGLVHRRMAEEDGRCKRFKE